MEHIDSKQKEMHSAWRSPLKIGGVPPLAGRGYDNFSLYPLSSWVNRLSHSHIPIKLLKPLKSVPSPRKLERGRI